MTALPVRPPSRLAVGPPSAGDTADDQESDMLSRGRKMEEGATFYDEDGSILVEDRRAAMGAVAQAWKKLQAHERSAARAWCQVEDEVDELVKAQSREEECADAATQARVRMRQVHGEADAKVGAARANGRAAVEHAMEEASARLRVMVVGMHRADEDLAAARATTDDAQDMVDALDAKAVCADALAEQAQAEVRAAEESAEWIWAVAAVARLWREQRRVAAASAGASAVARLGGADAGVTSAGVLVPSALVPSAFRSVANHTKARCAP
eukprot:SAG11_NODE_178_length_13331_cov_17.694906_2_plen_269_part_00